MPTKLGGAAALDGAHHPVLLSAERVGLSIRGPMGTENLRELQPPRPALRAWGAAHGSEVHRVQQRIKR